MAECIFAMLTGILLGVMLLILFIEITSPDKDQP